MRQTVPVASSLIKRAPSAATATPTGRPPYIAVRRDEPCQKVVILAGGLAVIEPHADQLITRAVHPVPRTVTGDKNIAAIFGRELRAVVNGESQRRGMRLQKNIRRQDFVAHLGKLAVMVRILMGADIIKWPAVKTARLDARYIIGRQIVAEPVALVNRGP